MIIEIFSGLGGIQLIGSIIGNEYLKVREEILIIKSIELRNILNCVDCKKSLEELIVGYNQQKGSCRSLLYEKWSKSKLYQEHYAFKSTNDHYLPNERMKLLYRELAQIAESCIEFLDKNKQKLE